ncbi:MAG: 30S ribosomal protein S9 [Desulfatiglandales bacterium]
MAQNIYYATGKRKTAVARVWMKAGEGNVIINKTPFENYFFYEAHRLIALDPLLLTGTKGKFDILVNLSGGGVSSQAQALRHGISKALVLFNPEFRDLLKRHGYLTRDSREKERKKYGRRGARARFQYSKR